MRFLCGCVFALLVVAAMPARGDVPGQPPDRFELRQNIPNPFCGNPEVPGSSAAEIRYALPQRAEILLMVWSPDTTSTVRILVYGAQAAGFYTARWDGRDQDGFLVSDGDYPYSLVANEIDGGSVLFADTLTARVSCTTSAIENETWGAVKCLYGD
jgi:hypothetical protein